MQEVAQFHHLAHIFISLIGGVLLLVIYLNILKRFKQVLDEEDNGKRVDQGLLYLSLALFTWVASGGWAYLSESLAFQDQLAYVIGVNILSIVNSMFFLLALLYFDDAPNYIYKNAKNVKMIIIAIASVMLLSVILSITNNGGHPTDININNIPDLLLSGFLSYLLIVSLYRTFVNRQMHLVAWLAVISVSLIFISQLPDLFPGIIQDFTHHLIKITAKTSLIFIFLVLATTWVIQLSLTPRIKEIEIKFTDWSMVQLSIPSKDIFKMHIDFGSRTTQFKNLIKFAIRRKHGSGDQQGIRVGAGSEISNQTYLSRIVDNINEILDLQGSCSLERNDIFTFLGDGIYRLRMLPNHIIIDEDLLQEFSNKSENQDYKSLL